MHDHPHNSSRDHGSNPYARPGHNNPDHLHSHAHGDGGREQLEELKGLAASFVDGFRKAEDKTSFLRLANVPFKLSGGDGLPLYLVDAEIVSAFQIGTASPGFGTREISYLPFPGELVKERESMRLTYVSLNERRDVDLLELIGQRFA